MSFSYWSAPLVTLLILGNSLAYPQITSVPVNLHLEVYGLFLSPLNSSYLQTNAALHLAQGRSLSQLFPYTWDFEQQCTNCGMGSLIYRSWAMKTVWTQRELEQNPHLWQPSKLLFALLVLWAGFCPWFPVAMHLFHCPLQIHSEPEV